MDWKKTWSVWVNGALAVLGALGAALTFLVNQQDIEIPLHVLLELLAGVGAFTVFLRSLPQSPKEPPVSSKVPPSVMMLFISLLSISLMPAALGCTPAQAQETAKVVTHVASNGAAEAVTWVDATIAARFEIASEKKITELEASKGTSADWERWRVESGWAAALDACALAVDAHGRLVAHIDGKNLLSEEERKETLATIMKGVNLGLDLLEKQQVKVPEYVRVALNELPKLGALL